MEIDLRRILRLWKQKNHQTKYLTMKRKGVFIILSILVIIILMIGISLILNAFFDSVDKIKYDNSYSAEMDQPNSLRYFYLYGFILVMAVIEFYLYKFFWKAK